MDKFQDGSFGEKESLFTIFCNLAISHTDEMAELRRLDELRAENRGCGYIT
jgi:hypothetical protein